MISPVVRLRLKPWWPVEQKRQPTSQAGLRRDAQGGAVFLGDVDRLDRVALADVEQPLARAVGGGFFGHHRQRADLRRAGQLGAQRARQVGHAVEVAHAAVMDPAKQLGRAKRLLTHALAVRLEGRLIEVQQVVECRRHDWIPVVPPRRIAAGTPA